MLDTGIWPEHPSFDDPGISHPGGSYGCEFGLSGEDGDDAFACNDKLIGAYAFTETYLAVLGAEPGEFCNMAAGVCSARDADGHGTHTASTAAGSPVASAPLFGIERGPINGIAPGAHVIMYRVCLDQGCFQSDSVAAIEQAMLDGVDVINFSIAGGASPFSDPVELAFLEAYAAGITVNASAGNAGPGAATADHGGPWVTTVGASTSSRHFLTTLELAGGATLSLSGASITPGIETPTDVVLATDVGGDTLCSSPLAAGSATGKVVVCEGARSRNVKSFNVMQGGAVGMILYNPTDLDLFTDNFWIPTVMLTLDAGAQLLAFLAANTGETAQWEPSTPTAVLADRMTAFSSRGPVSDFLKPDVTAPGNQILAGTTPQPWPGAVFSRAPGSILPVHLGHVDVVPARCGRVGAREGRASGLDARADQVGADDVVGADGREGGRRHAGGPVRPWRRLHPGRPRRRVAGHVRRGSGGLRRGRGGPAQAGSTSTCRASTRPGWPVR